MSSSQAGHRRRIATRLVAVAVLLVSGVLVACEAADVEQTYPRREGRRVDPNPQGERETLFGPGGLNLLGGRGEEGGQGGGGSSIAVNSFLWRASLDTLAFMPLASADPFGGVIITDWYSPPETPDERFKMTVYILDRRLRADGLKVAVFRQARQNGTEWRDASVAQETPIELENAILTRARQLRIDATAQ